eukprot:6229060-Prymnesium_polylepis.2
MENVNLRPNFQTCETCARREGIRSLLFFGEQYLECVDSEGNGDGSGKSARKVSGRPSDRRS